MMSRFGDRVRHVDYLIQLGECGTSLLAVYLPAGWLVLEGCEPGVLPLGLGPSNCVLELMS